MRRRSERVREQRRAWRASYPPRARREAGGGEHGVVGVRSTVGCRAALELQEVNEAFAKRPLNFFFLSQKGPRLILLFPF